MSRNVMKCLVRDLNTGVCVFIKYCITTLPGRTACALRSVTKPPPICHRPLGFNDRLPEIRFRHLCYFKPSRHVICWETSGNMCGPFPTHNRSVIIVSCEAGSNPDRLI